MAQVVQGSREGKHHDTAASIALFSPAASEAAGPWARQDELLCHNVCCVFCAVFRHLPRHSVALHAWCELRVSRQKSRSEATARS